MIVTPAELNELETFFQTVALPKTLKQNAAVTVNDLPSFVKQTLANLRNLEIAEVALKPRFDDLVTIRKIPSSPAQ